MNVSSPTNIPVKLQTFWKNQDINDEDELIDCLEKVELARETALFTLDNIKKSICKLEDISDERTWKVLNKILRKAEIITQKKDTLTREISTKCIQILEEYEERSYDLDDTVACINLTWIHKSINISLYTWKVLKFESSLFPLLSLPKQNAQDLKTPLFELSEKNFSLSNFHNLDFNNRLELDLIELVDMLKHAKYLEDKHLIINYRNKIERYLDSKAYIQEEIIEDFVSAFDYALMSSDTILQNKLISLLLTKSFCGYGKLNQNKAKNSSWLTFKINSWNNFIPKNQEQNLKIIKAFLNYDTENILKELVNETGLFNKNPNDMITDAELHTKRLTALLFMFSNTYITIEQDRRAPLISIFENMCNLTDEEFESLAIPSLYILFRIGTEVQNPEGQAQENQTLHNQFILKCFIALNNLDKKFESELILIIKYLIAEKKCNAELATSFLNQIIDAEIPFGLTHYVSYLRGQNKTHAALDMIEKIQELRDLEDPLFTLMNLKAEILFMDGKIQEAEEILDQIEIITGPNLILKVYNLMRKNEWVNANKLMEKHLDLYFNANNNITKYMVLFNLTCNINSLENPSDLDINNFVFNYRDILKTIDTDLFIYRPLFNSFITSLSLKFTQKPALKLPSLSFDNESYKNELTKIKTAIDAVKHLNFIEKNDAKNIEKLCCFAINMYNKKFYQVAFNALQLVIKLDIKNETAKKYIYCILKNWKDYPKAFLEFCQSYHKELLNLQD